MTHSMTGFATKRGETAEAEWQWDIRGVNAKGLDVRLRLPDWIEGIEAATRPRLVNAMGRGSVNVSLKVSRTEGSGAVNLNEAELARVLNALAAVEDRAVSLGLTLAQPTAADVLTQRGVMETASSAPLSTDTIAAIQADLDHLIADFVEMRAVEGQALNAILTDQLSQIETHTLAAKSAAEERSMAAREMLKTALARVLDNVDGVDEDRLTQELALLAVKADITEEIDRLQAHVTAARGLVAQDGPVGRKLDFLAQEFNREANTLCSKSGTKALTAIGLDLKAVIDQMREQVQNVE